MVLEYASISSRLKVANSYQCFKKFTIFCLSSSGLGIGEHENEKESPSIIFLVSPPKDPARGGIKMRGFRSGISNRILDAIPYDEWVTASEISSKSGIGSIKLALIISERLLNVDVERRKPTTSERGKFYEYRRIERTKSRTWRQKVN